jgi:hypothetical protein
MVGQSHINAFIVLKFAGRGFPGRGEKQLVKIAGLRADLLSTNISNFHVYPLLRL